jgi:hypothetical protein
MTPLLEELDAALMAFRAEVSYTDWHDHPRLLEALRAKDKLVAMSKGDYKSLWEIEKKAHEETQQRAAAEKREARAKLLRVSCAYLKKLGASAPAPASSSCAKCRLPPSCCGCTDAARLLWRLVGTLPIDKPASALEPEGTPAAATPALPSSPPPETDEDLYD